MSTTQSVPIATCKHCREQFEKPTGFDADHCSEKCYFERKGSKALNLIKHDHRFCGSCFRQLKEIEKPPEATLEELTNETSQALVGFQYRTPNATTATKSFKGSDEYTRIYARGTGCECGITDTREEDPDLRELELAAVLARVIKRFRELHAEGQLDQQIDKDVFFDCFKDTRNLPYSLGRSLFGK